MHPLETYLRELSEIRASGAGVKETSYYPALSDLLNAVGKTMRPRVRCIVNLRNRGAGLPDGGLFTPDQFQRGVEEPIDGQLPARGVIEVKGTGDDAWVTAKGKQVTRYWGKYRQVLATNYRDFVLVGADPAGKPVKLETFRLADNEQEFWHCALHPRKTADEIGERLVDYLKRVMLQAAPLADPEDVAWFLASYARDARARIEHSELPALATVRAALEEALGLHFEGERGNHFFRSSLVQTLFYGLFSAWVLWSRRHAPTDQAARFNWHEASWSLHVPMIRALYEQIATPAQIGPLGLVEVLDWTGAALNRVDRASFFAKFEEAHAVQYFYEPFLEAFDPELRKQLGVWYTPPEVVSYMVARVDTVLREELGIGDGLADPSVYVLDPCCGTGTYLVEVLKRIDTTLRQRGVDALHAHDLKRAAMERVFGFEILPAPFVVAHLQLGLLLQQLGAPLAGTRPEQQVFEGRQERVAVYLTNALTGWEPPEEAKQHLIFPEMEAERDAADRVKQHTPVLVILGNPPYNGFAGVAVDEERELTRAYRTTRRAPAPQGQGLNDLYVRFYRMAERKIVEHTGRGIVCFISNYSWLDGLSFTGMRERYLEVFDRIWIDNLNGDKYRTGKLTPEGDPDPSIFSTESNREGIQVGTAIALLVRNMEHRVADEVRYLDVWGKDKRGQLLRAVQTQEDSRYTSVKPVSKLGLPITVAATSREYSDWPALLELFPVAHPGVKTSRDDVVIDIDHDRLVARMTRYFDPAVTHDEIRREFPAAMLTTAQFNAKAVRDRLRKRGFFPNNVVRYCYRPFDVRWLYWEPETALIDRKRPEFFANVRKGNLFIEARQKQTMERFDRGYVTTCLGDNFGNGLSSFFPLLSPPSEPGTLFAADTAAGFFNVSERAAAYAQARAAMPPQLFAHTVSILHSPANRAENAGALRQDWPRIPLPDRGDVLHASANLGQQLIRLFDSDAAVPGVTRAKLRPEMRVLGTLVGVHSRALDPSAGELAVTARWGIAGKGGIAMPGKGKLIERAYLPDERAAIVDGASALGLDAHQAVALLGETTFDIYLNDVAYWRNIPARVWEYTLGGYQVVKKWLSYRELLLLGRSLKPEEAREVTNIVRRIAALVLLEPQLDANYAAVKAGTYDWPRRSTDRATEEGASQKVYR